LAWTSFPVEPENEYPDCQFGAISGVFGMRHVGGHRVWNRCKRQYCYKYIGNVRVTVTGDFTGRMPDGTLVITDWKTDRDDDEYETELQMAAYVLWTQEFYTKSADEISTELIFLKTGATKPYAFYENQLLNVQVMIPQGFTAMNAW